MQNINLQNLLGKPLKVAFRETPNSPMEIRKGTLIGVDDLFIQLKTPQNIYLINRRHIIHLKIFGGGE